MTNYQMAMMPNADLETFYPDPNDPYDFDDPLQQATEMAKSHGEIYIYSRMEQQLLHAAQLGTEYGHKCAKELLRLQKVITDDLDTMMKAVDERGYRVHKASALYRMYASVIRAIMQTGTPYSSTATVQIRELLLDTQLPRNELESEYWKDPYTGEEYPQESELPWTELYLKTLPQEKLKIYVPEWHIDHGSPLRLLINTLKYDILKRERYEYIDLDQATLNEYAAAMDDVDHPRRKEEYWAYIYLELKKARRRYTPVMSVSQWNHYISSRQPYNNDADNQAFVRANTGAVGDLYDPSDELEEDRHYIPPPIQAGLELQTTQSFPDMMKEYYDTVNLIFSNGPWENDAWEKIILNTSLDSIVELTQWALTNYPYKREPLITDAQTITREWVKWNRRMLSTLMWHKRAGDKLVELFEKFATEFVEIEYQRMNAQGTIENHLSKRMKYEPVDVCTFLATIESSRFLQETELYNLMDSRCRQFYLDNREDIYEKTTQSAGTIKTGDPTPDEIDQMTKGILEEYAAMVPYWRTKQIVIDPKTNEPKQVTIYGREFQLEYTKAICNGSSLAQAYEIAMQKDMELQSPEGAKAYQHAVEVRKFDKRKAWGPFYGAARRAGDLKAVPIEVKDDKLVVRVIAEDKEIPLTWEQAMIAYLKGKLVISEETENTVIKQASNKLRSLIILARRYNSLPDKPDFNTARERALSKLAELDLGIDYIKYLIK